MSLQRQDPAMSALVLVSGLLLPGMAEAELASSSRYSIDGATQSAVGGESASDSFGAASIVGEPTPSSEEGMPSSQSFGIDTGLFSVEIPVAIDIRPGGEPNSINTRSRGTVAVAILSAGAFDAPADIAVETVLFGPSGSEAAPEFCGLEGEDVNADGMPDLVCHFRIQGLQFQPGDELGVLKGQSSDGGTDLVGTDSVLVVR